MTPMLRLVRTLGFLMIAGGALVLVAWIIPPLRGVWPWLRELPWPVQVGLGAAAVGFVLLFSTVVWERLESRVRDRSLLDDHL